MKRLFASAFLLLAGVCASQAQVSVPKPLFDTDNAVPDFSSTSAAKITLPDFFAATDLFAQLHTNSTHSFTKPLTTALLAEPAPADPATPSPKPRFVYGGREDYRWQLSVSAAWLHFNSSAFNANPVGLKTTVTYYLNEWLGVEGSVTAAFAPAMSNGQGVKIALYGGGPKVAWRQQRWEPWVHAIFGGAHENPQTAFSSKSAYSIMAGGGADYRWNPHLSFRLEGDYVRTGFFGQSQNNFQLAGGVVLHF